MIKKARTTFILILALSLLTILIDVPKFNFLNREFNHVTINTPFFKRNLEPRLGLDLAGGVQLTLSADMKDVEENSRADAIESAKNIVENRINSLGVAEPVVQTAKTQDQYRLIVEIAGISDIDQAISTVKKTAHLEFRTVRGDVSEEATPQSLEEVYQPSGLTGKDLNKATAQASRDPNSPGYVVSLEFNNEGAKKFEEITKNNVGKPVAIFLDGSLISAPTVQNVIADGNAQISGSFSSEEAKQLAIELNAGALPVPLKIESQTRVGPTLGSQYVEKSLFAAAVGIIAVSIFMIFYYRVLGIFAVTALIIYSMIVFAIFKIIPVTLTLAGIAGFILSVGMAVDANILIFERIKEERRWGRPKHEAFYSGFNRAWSSIRDSNVSSLITTAILFNFGTGAVRGFALTLAIGILVSMFSAITVSKTLLRLFWVRNI